MLHDDSVALSLCRCAAPGEGQSRAVPIAGELDGQAPAVGDVRAGEGKA